jgi:hypothetical protein
VDALGGHSGPSHEPSWISTSSCSQRSRNAAPGTFFFGQSPYREHPRVAILKRCIFSKELRMAVVSSFFRASNPQNFKYLQTFFFLELYTRWRVIPFSGLPSGSARIPHEERSNKGMTSALLGHTFGAVSCVFFLFHKLLSAGCKTRLIRSQSCGADGSANSDETPDVRAMPLLLPSIWILQQKCGCARFAFKADCLVLQSVSTLPSIRSCKMEDFRKGGGKSYSPYVRPNS